MTHIYKVGIELEGGWDKTLKFSDGLVEDLIIQDESLQLIQNDEGIECRHWGEIVSPPLDKEKALAWTLEHYPDFIRLAPANKDGSGGCGLHIHTSFNKPTDYALLGSFSFYSYFLQEMTKKAKVYEGPENQHILARLKGVNKYCAKILRTQDQVTQTSKSVARPFRRSHLNFCWKMHGTLECRLLPMFYSKEDAVKWISVVIDLQEKWLSGLPAKTQEKLLKGNLVIKY